MSDTKQPQRGFQYLASQDAFEIQQKQSNALLVDVRSEMEFLMIGHPVGAVNVPWIDEPDWEINPHFTADVRKLLLGRVSGVDRGQVPIMLICRSANRSEDAANMLAEAGVPNIFVVEDGFEGPLDDSHQRSSSAGWRFQKLPWEQC